MYKMPTEDRKALATEFDGTPGHLKVATTSKVKLCTIVVQVVNAVESR